MADPLNFCIRILHRVKAGTLTTLTFYTFGLSKVDTTGQFADNQEVKTTTDHFFLQA